jgi:hypothetical protein
MPSKSPVPIRDLLPPSVFPGGPGDRVLIVDFVNADQFPGQIPKTMPFLHGALDLAGIPCVHLRFGVATDNQAVHGRDALTLAPGELELLVRHAVAHRANLAILTHAVTEEQEQALRQACPGLQVVLDPPFAPDTATRLMDRPGFAPEYRWVAGNPAASAPSARHAYLMTDRYCYHDLDVRQNPLFEGVEWPQGTRCHGCSFCGQASLERPPEGQRGPGAGRILARVRLQLRALARARRAGLPLEGLLVESLAGLPPLGKLFDAMREAGLADVALLMAARADQLLRAERALTRFLASPQGRDARVGVYVTGLESFVAEDLARFNKGTTPEQNRRAVRLMQALEARFPGRFQAGAYRPYCLVLFTPWTTLEGLELNLRTVRELGLQAELGNVFRARLRLHADTALLELARRDRLLVDQPQDPFDRLNRFKLFPGEHPWRFRDARVEGLARLSLRLQPSVALGADPLYAEVRARLAEAFPGRTPDQATLVDLLYHATAAALDDHALDGAGPLLAAGLARWQAGLGPAQGATEAMQAAPDLPPVRLRVEMRRVGRGDGRQVFQAQVGRALEVTVPDQAGRVLARLVQAALKHVPAGAGPACVASMSRALAALLKKNRMDGLYDFQVELAE